MINAIFSIPIIQRLQREDYRPILRFVVVLGVLILAAAASFASSQLLSILLIGLPIAIGIVFLFLRYPALGIIAIIPASFIIPFEIGVSSGSSLNAPMLIIILMTGLWLFDMVAKKRQIKFVSSRSLAPLGIFIVIIFLAFINGQLPWFAYASKAPITAQIGGLALFLLSASVFLLVAHQIRDIIWLKAIVWIFLGLGTIFFLTQIVPGMKRIGFQIYNYGALTSLFWTWMVALSLGQAIYNPRLPTWQRVGLTFLAVISIYFAYTVVSGWKSGWVPALATFFVLIALRSYKMAAMLGMGGLVLSPFIFSRLIETDQYSYATRTEAWLLIAKIIKASPILGLGPANYYWYTPLFPIRGYAVQYNSHNQYVDIIAQVGFLGLLAFLWFLFEIGRLGWKLRVSAPDGFAKAYVYSALAGLVGMVTAAMLGDWVLPFVYNVGFIGFRASLFGWLFLGGLVALEIMIEVENP